MARARAQVPLPLPPDGGVAHRLQGVDIVVACTGRLIEFVEAGILKLDNVTYLVVDDADLLMDLGFLPQVSALPRAPGPTLPSLPPSLAKPPSVFFFSQSDNQFSVEGKLSTGEPPSPVPSNANRNEPSRGRSLLHGQDMGETQNHRIVEQWLAVGGGWWFVVLGAVLNKNKAFATPTETNVHGGRSLLHGQDMGETQYHRISVEQWLAVGGDWRLAVGGRWEPL